MLSFTQVVVLWYTSESYESLKEHNPVTFQNKYKSQKPFLKKKIKGDKQKPTRTCGVNVSLPYCCFFFSFLESRHSLPFFAYFFSSHPPTRLLLCSSIFGFPPFHVMQIIYVADLSRKTIIQLHSAGCRGTCKDLQRTSLFPSQLHHLIFFFSCHLAVDKFSVFSAFFCPSYSLTNISSATLSSALFIIYLQMKLSKEEVPKVW